MKPRIFNVARLSLPLATALASLLAMPSIHAQSWSSSATSGAWLTTTNWTGGVAAGSSTDTANTNIAVFNVNVQNTIGIAMSSTGGVYYLGAIDNTNNTARTINNGSTTAGVLTLNGATVNSVANTIVRNTTGSLLTITNGSGAGTMGLGLGNATNNIIQITGAGGITIPCIISGVGRNLTRQGTGAGVLILAGANTYTGTTSVSAGAVNIQNATALGTVASGTTVSAGAALQIQNNITVGAEALSLSGEGVTGAVIPLFGTGSSATGALRSISGNNTFGGAITLGSASRINSDTAANTLTLTGGITGTNFNLSMGGLGNTTISTNGIATGTGSLIKDNLGTVTLAAANSYTGTTTVLGGTLAIARQTALYNGTVVSWTAANINVKAGATLALNVDTLGTNGFTEANLNTLLSNISVAASSTAGLHSGSLIGIDTTSAGGSFTPTAVIGNSTGAFGGSIGLTKLGTGSLVLDLANTYTGITSVSAGTLQLGSGGTTGSLDINSPITVASGATFAINQTDTVTQGTDFSGAPITGAGGFTQAGSGTTILNAANTFTGTTLVSDGVLQLNNALALQYSALSTSGVGTIVLGPGVTLPTFGGVTGSADISLVIPAYSGVTNLILNPQSGITNSFGGVISNGAAGMNFTKTGAGTQTLTGVNTYTGATFIDAGVLNLSGAAGSIATSTGMVLTNTGTITLTNTTALEGAVNRVSDTATITSHGGVFNYTNTSGTGVNYAETIGAIDLVRGQLAFNLTNTQLGSQVLTVADITRTGSGNTSTVSVNGGPNTTTSQFVVTSKVGNATPAGQIIGPWFNTNGTGAGTADYAVYNASGQVVGSGTTPSAESTWTNPDNAYTMRAAGAGGTTGAAVLGATRNMVGLRIDTFSTTVTATQTGSFFTWASNTLTEGDPVVFAGVVGGLVANTPYYVINVGGNGPNTFQVSTSPGGSAFALTASGSPTIVPGIRLGSGANLGTTGILQQSGVTTVIAPGSGGVVTLPSTTSGNLFINTGGSNLATGNLNVIAPIADNGAGALTLVKSGAGTLTLSGTNTYTGGTVLNAGTVVINSNSSFGDVAGVVTVDGDSRINAVGGTSCGNPINVKAGRTLTLQNPATGVSSTATFSGVLSGTGTLSLPNSGVNAIQGILAFTNEENTFTGNVVLSSTGSGDEHFRFNSIGDGGNFTFAKNGNRQLISYAGSADITFNTRQISIASTMVNGGATDRQGLDGGGTNPVSMFANDGTGTVTFTQNMVVNNISSTYGVLYFGGTNSGDNTFSGIISDTSGSSKFAIGKFGTGKWILSGANTYEGNALIANGTLSVPTIANANIPQPLGIGPAFQLGVGGGGSNGTLQYTGAAASTDKQVQVGPNALNAPAASSGGGIVNDGTGALTFTNPIFNPATTGVTGTRTLTLGGSYEDTANTIQGVIQNNATGGLVALSKTGASTWTLSAVNTYTGATTISGGTLRVSGSGQLGAGTYGGAISNNGILRYSSSATQTLSGNMTGSGALIKDVGASNLTLSGNSNFSGGTSLNAGTITVNSSTALGTGEVSMVAGTRLLVGVNNVTLANNITLNGSATSGALYSGDFAAGNVTNFTGIITLAATSNVSTWWNDKTLRLSGKITGPGGLNFIRQTTSVGGRFFITGADNDYAGNTSVTGDSAPRFGYTGQAMLYLGATNALPVTTNLTLNNADLYLNGQSQTLPSITGTGTFSIQNGSTTPAALTLGSGDVSSTLAGAILDNGIAVTNTSATPTSVTGRVSLTKIGSGTLTLTAANTFTGDTVVEAGALTLADNAQLKFVLGATSGSNNSISGAGTAVLDGDFVIDTTAADALPSGTWTLENVSPLTGAYGSTFTVVGFTDAGSNKWTKINGSKIYTFDETTGILTLAPNVGYSTWAAVNAIGSAANLDKDGDGVSNAVEYVLGGDVNTNDLGKLPTLDASGANLVFTFKRDRDSLDGNTAVVIEVGDNLTGWPDVFTVGATTGTSTAGVTVTESSPEGFDTITLSVPKGVATKKFARLKVTVTE